MKKRKKSKQGVWILIVSCIFGGIIGGLYSIFIMPYFEAHGVSVFWGLVFLIVAFYAQTIIHEGGHLIFGLMTGYKFSSFRIFNIMLLKTDGRLKFKKVHIAGTGGQCLMAPPENTENPKFVLYNLGGCFLNIIVSVIFTVVALFSVNLPYLMGLSICMVVCGIIFALLNGIPLSTDSMPNDGYNTRLMLKYPSSVKSLWVQLMVNQKISEGVRVSEMPQEWFTLPSDEEMNNALHAAIAVFRANKLVDEHKFDEARTLISHILKIDSGIVGIHENLLRCDLIYIELILGNKDQAKELLTKELLAFMKAMKSFPSVIRTNYTIALSGEENIKSPESYLKAFEKVAKSYPYHADIQSERELIEIAKEWICK